ncbi:IS66 family insertion sequence element accessory protein TnpB [Paracoccus benzoatiresistens]|uniref:IS66 family insertion sequence element accessory protein TnpB n=1 Tax=Paracoccus benzoatiresistens TaxID=2997341 RepID=A0ABT4JAY0_9RHOB|nr:IS66 family insertion sequence element accessory protein TnpB [Paracoccus sp. EF6]MCZ0964293.1 IS66 family insertion sequence element accessory protein TnpB [Paracoccus sp. EF6]
MKVFVATRPVDFRKGIDGLALAVQEMFGLDPFCGAVFVFRAKRADRIKLLAWDQTRMVLVHKRLEGGKFVWPQVRDGVMRMSSAQMAGEIAEKSAPPGKGFFLHRGLESDAIHGRVANVVEIAGQRAPGM